MSLGLQVSYLFLLAIPIACISWTITHEEIFREPRDRCVRISKTSTSFISRKFFYVFTCEYCFSHYITILFLLLTRYQLLYQDWKGYLVAGFSLVWIANVYMSIFALIKMDIKKDRLEIKEKEMQQEPTDKVVTENDGIPIKAK